MSEGLFVWILPPPMQGSCRKLYALSPAFRQGIGLICVNWSMTCWMTEECPKTAIRFVTCGGCNVVYLDCKQISKASLLVEILEMCAEAAKALALWIKD